jgi:hypothetical protein
MDVGSFEYHINVLSQPNTKTSPSQIPTDRTLVVPETTSVMILSANTKQGMLLADIGIL